jgi:hypothetical protein
MTPLRETTKKDYFLARTIKMQEFSGALSIGLYNATPAAKNPVDAIVRCARRLVRESGILEPPFRPATLATLRNVSQILYRTIEEEGRLVPHQAGFTIELRIDRSFQRKNFTCAHEIAHTFFYEAVPSVKYHRLNSLKAVRDNEEELLCNIAASELLMPDQSIRKVGADYVPSATALQEIARIYETSLTATAVRVLGLGIWNAKFILWDLSDGYPRALWFAQPRRTLVHFPSLDIENYEMSSILKAFEVEGRVEGEEWLCIDRRFTFCKISSIRLANSTRVLSCIGAFGKSKRLDHPKRRQLSIPVEYACECNGTGTRLISHSGQTFAAPCLACKTSNQFLSSSMLPSPARE